MAKDQAVIGFPYYTARADGGSEIATIIDFNVRLEDGGGVDGLSEDDVADAIHAYLAGLTGTTASSLTKHEISDSNL